jgi:hypothetical protein
MRLIFGRFEGTACAAGRAFNTGDASFLKLTACHFNHAKIGAFGARSGGHLLTDRVAMSCPFNGEDARDFEGPGLVVAPLDNGGCCGKLLGTVEGLPNNC